MMGAVASHKSPSATRADEPVFSATIMPHRSLGRSGFRLVMTLVCLASVVSSIPFIILGAWPVAGFFGLDLLALYVAFLLNYRDGRGFEEILLTRVELLLRRVSPRGVTREWRFNPLWTKLDRRTNGEFGVERLALVSRGEQVVFAQALSAAEKASFADALSGALAKARRGG
jgi:uncharacterized membrane protein